MKKRIIILCGMAVVIVLILSYRHFYSGSFAPTVSETPEATYGFVGTVISMKSNILIVRGLSDNGTTKTSQEIVVTMTPDTKIFRKDPPSMTAYAKTPSTMDELYEAVNKEASYVLFRATAGYDFYGTGKVTPTEVIYATSADAGAL